jgi:hypothetical protein
MRFDKEGHSAALESVRHGHTLIVVKLGGGVVWAEMGFRKTDDVGSVV